ncbi:BrnA antitoxin family protein [Rhizobium lemnae]|uniref:BrnA antitoxin family protein n=1 Tax=Rhizobium lemnae TaxID=1214924 RepID=A0ABV8E3Y1_9HYPH|nr:BrnA antitoxin family protein [Rhizobium lemnae]MCJ8507524.1 BrnA antitoxin family protein [Rhizobium lemnae]
MVTTPDRSNHFVEGRGYSQADWDSVDSAPLTEEELEAMRPAREVLPAQFFEALDVERKRRGRPVSDSPKIAVTLRVDADVLEEYRKQGKGWQTKMNEVLRKAAGL